MGGMYAYSYQTIIPLPMLRAKFLAIFFFSFPKGILKILIHKIDFFLKFMLRLVRYKMISVVKYFRRNHFQKK
jgi:hypothetical protein